MKTENLFGNKASVFVAVTSGLSLLIGLIVLIGWHTHNMRLLHIHPSFVAMAYNTALGFFFCGIGLLAITLRRPRLAIVGGVFGILCGSLTLGEYLLGRDLGIDELFMKAYTNAGVTNNARMAVNTALCFLLLGVAQLLLNRRDKPAWLLPCTGLIGALVFGLGTIALSGYFVGITSYYAWGHFTRMAVHTAAGFMILGLAVLTWSWQESLQRGHIWPRWLPAPVGVGILTATLCLWQALIVEQDVQLDWLHRIAGNQSLPGPLLRMQYLVPQVALGIGLMMTALLTGLVYLAQTSRRRARQIADVNAELNDQVVVRKEAEEALRRAHDTLEIRVQERTADLAAANIALQEQIAERERLENQLLQSQKLESVGRLAGGVAHDFNNLLTIIFGYAELAIDTLPPEDRARPHIHQVQQAAERASNLTRQLLAFARRQVIQPQLVDLNTLILNLDPMLRRLIGENIELSVLPAADRAVVLADPGQLEQIVLNLVVNSRDAMPRGGRIIVETADRTVYSEETHRHERLPAGDYALLVVKDTGFGMDTEIQEHIFEPFFTTKEIGKGTGLGLATCYGIVKQAKGHILLDSAPGKGAAFTIYLPRAAETPDATADLEARQSDQDGTETIMLVEDEAAVRALASHTLRARGYTVLEASHGEEALRSLQTYAGEIALLVTDVIMPQMGGQELARKIQPTRPNLRVLYTSGYAESMAIHHAKPGIEAPFLSKPFTPEELTRKVRYVLDANGTSS